MVYNYLRLERAKALIFPCPDRLLGPPEIGLRDGLFSEPHLTGHLPRSVSSNELHMFAFLWVYDLQEGLYGQVQCGMSSSQKWVALLSDPSVLILL